jgi:hypothetical protein
MFFLCLYIFSIDIPAMNNHRNFALWDSHVTSYIMYKIYHDIVLYISREILPVQEMKMFDIMSLVSLENNNIYLYWQIIHFPLISPSDICQYRWSGFEPESYSSV